VEYKNELGFPKPYDLDGVLMGERHVGHSTQLFRCRAAQEQASPDKQAELVASQQRETDYESPGKQLERERQGFTPPY